ncbi:BREX system ATP-binding domain-containing protein [Mesorhizobium sp. B2-7-1]|uniref:BREX system ATP-binding domain-containing protein n=1 Tax=Mesorhizobium sp. B2-7-1 TaxID=2589909 RepID=UPI001127AFA6|nr:BREX system ATP-binding domain-containing protein [Mesorhizobium sp. B2-7-1]TPJ62782.1 hypothetical protein FJ471_16355 [Mesorhizobium sp. B2-7-1]
MTSILGGLLQDVAERREDGGAFLARYGMLRNPFPPARTIYPEVIYNQEKAVHLFADGVKAILGADIARRTMAVIGGTGQGKSHFQRHCQYEVKHLKLPVVAVEFLAGTSSAANLVREIFRAADEHVRELGEQDLLSAIVGKVGDGDLGPVRQTDLKNALLTLVRSQKKGFQPEDMHQRFTSEVLLDTCRRWVVGETLSQTEKRYLRVSSRLATASLMIRVMTELFSLARQQGFFKGVMLCLDEVEALFFSGVSASRIQAFLQDLRYLFDEAHGQSSGYSLLVVAGSTLRGVQDLREYNYPLFQRLGFDTEARIQLHEVKDLDEARSFAEVYIEFERDRYNAERKPSVSSERARSLISDDDLKSAFLGDPKTGDTRNQARLLEGLHRIVEAKKAAAEKH